MSNSLMEWLKQFKIEDINLDLLNTAFTHRSIKGLRQSYKIEERDDDYERLEFLGDAVLDLVVSDKLYNRVPLSEGNLTVLRSRMVNEKTLGDLFDALKMKPFVRSALPKLSQKVKCDILESFFAVIYIEKGFRRCQEVWDLIMKKTKIEDTLLSSHLDTESIENDQLTPSQIEERKTLRRYYESIEIKTDQNARNVLEQLFAKVYGDPSMLPDFNDFEKTETVDGPRFIVRLNETIILLEKKYYLHTEGVARRYKLAQIRAAEKACDMIYLPYTKR
ncbi:MAG: hypothetical protein GF364_16265 [Candidatus Lokiarchaeota archaeon]|nr:hypothetical protein [Candidatus Lokiarchaeota archaeon]